MVRNAALHIPSRVPTDEELPARLAAVATTVHLLFTAGHAGGDALVRPELGDREAAVAAYTCALGCRPSSQEAAFLRERVARS